MNEINYNLIRSRRKTVSLYLKDGILTVRAPLKTPVEYINKFISDKAQWIEKKCNSQAATVALYSDYLSFKKFMCLGKSYSPSFAEVKNIVIAEEKILFPLKMKLYDKKKFFAAIIKFYKTEAMTVFASFLNKSAENVDVIFSKVSLSNAKTRWGSCDTKKNIKLNWRLIMLPEPIISYVIVHELCHILAFNHSKQFWQKVQIFCPDYKNLKKSLKQYQWVIGMFRD